MQHIGMVDNDFIHKIACYELFDRLATLPVIQGGALGILEVCRFVIAKKAKKKPPQKGLSNFLAYFSSILEQVLLITPTDEELALAGVLEAYAQEHGLNLDVGESQLCAILLQRGLPYLLTGDKRAIVAIERIFQPGSTFPKFDSKIICLEQAMSWLLQQGSGRVLQKNVCSEKEADRALSICFSCSSSDLKESECDNCLESYIRHLRLEAPTYLHES